MATAREDRSPVQCLRGVLRVDCGRAGCAWARTLPLDVISVAISSHFPWIKDGGASRELCLWIPPSARGGPVTSWGQTAAHARCPRHPRSLPSLCSLLRSTCTGTASPALLARGSRTRVMRPDIRAVPFPYPHGTCRVRGAGPRPDARCGRAAGRHPPERVTVGVGASLPCSSEHEGEHSELPALGAWV